MADETQTAAPDLLTRSTLYLCNIAYAADITTIPALILKTPVPAIGGIWRCLWGPAEDSDQSNLVFVAGFFPNPSLGPQSICVTIRGTDVDIADIWGIMEQIWEDIDAAHQVRLPWAPTRQFGPHCARHARGAEHHRGTALQGADALGLPDEVLWHSVA